VWALPLAPSAMPRSVPCGSCGQMFLPSGLRFHEKVCQKRQRETMTSCPYCKLEMAQVSMHGHVATCKVARRAMEPSRKEAGRTGTGWAPTATNGVARFPGEALDDGRMRCQFCGRAFTSNRIHEHSHICGGLRQARPHSIGGMCTQLPARVYNSAAARTSVFGSFDRQHQRLFIPRAMAESKGVLVRCAGVARKIGSTAAATLRPWTVLGVERHSSSAEVRAAYHRLAKEWHPDRHADDSKAEAEVRFKAIAEAYEAMTRPRRRPRPGGRKQLALVAPETWRAKHKNLMYAARSGRGVRQPMQSRNCPDHRIECPHCKRRFGEVQAERHISKCASVVNKPAPPPSRFSQPESPAKQARSPCISGTGRGFRNPRAAPSVDLVEGMPVSIEGLSSAAHLNGTVGVLRAFDKQVGRWHVGVDGAEIAVRVENLKPLCNRPASGQVNSSPFKQFRSPGRSTARSFDWAHVDRPPSQNSSNSASALEPGSKVRLDGLVGAAHLNGLSGILHHFDDSTLRWHVELPSGETKSVRAENLEALGLRVCGAPTPLCPRRMAKEPSGSTLPAVNCYAKGRC